jgi:hypothetical protein
VQSRTGFRDMRWAECVTTTTAACSLRMGCKTIDWPLWSCGQHSEFELPQTIAWAYLGPRLLEKLHGAPLHRFNQKEGEEGGGLGISGQLHGAVRLCTKVQYFQHATPPVQTESLDSSLYSLSKVDNLQDRLCSREALLVHDFTSSRGGGGCKRWTLRCAPGGFDWPGENGIFMFFMENSSCRVGNWESLGIAGNAVVALNALPAPCSSPRPMQLDPETLLHPQMNSSLTAHKTPPLASNFLLYCIVISPNFDIPRYSRSSA